MRLEIPELALVALIGASGSGKSTFARKLFKPTETLSSDYFRGLVSDDENNQRVTPQAFEILYFIANKRLELGRLTVIDATNSRKEAREVILRFAHERDCPAVAIVLDLPEKICQERNASRSERVVPALTVARQVEGVRRSIRFLRAEGFRFVHILRSPEEVEAAEIIRAPLLCDRRGDRGPFDIIGDPRGCYDELRELLEKLGYRVDAEGLSATPPAGRRAVFLGDLCDGGPRSRSLEVLRLVMGMARDGSALCVADGRDEKLLRWLEGANVQFTVGLDRVAQKLEAASEEFCAEAKDFWRGLASHYVFDGGKLVVAHAGLKEKYQGRDSARVRDFCLYGETAGGTGDLGHPARPPWASEYRGRALVVYGHKPTPEPVIENNAICVDTGCVFGGKLTAFRYPEREIVQVDAKAEYCPRLWPSTP
jgi:protein phosphatase